MLEFLSASFLVLIRACLLSALDFLKNYTEVGARIDMTLELVERYDMTTCTLKSSTEIGFVFNKNILT